MIVCFVDIDGIVDHHCLNFLFITSNSSFLMKSKVCRNYNVHTKCLVPTECDYYENWGSLPSGIGYISWCWLSQPMKLLWNIPLIVTRFKYLQIIRKLYSKGSLKILKGQSESVYRRRTDNTMAKRKRTNGQTTITYI